MKEDNDQQTKTRTTAFENPGYDSTGGVEDYDDIRPVTFAPFEENVEAGGFSNPTYGEIGMTSMSSSQNINKVGASGESASNNATPEGPCYEAAGELPKKAPLGEGEEVKPDYVEIIVEKETAAQGEPRYESLFSNKTKEAKSDQTEVEVEKKEEPRYATVPVRQEAGQTVLVLGDSDQPTKGSETSGNNLNVVSSVLEWSTKHGLTIQQLKIYLK